MSLQSLSSALVLAEPNHSERLRTWEATHPAWGTALTLEGYVEREIYLLDIPLARDGGLKQWILTGKSGQRDGAADGEDRIPRSILSTCDTWRKRVIYAKPRGQVHEAWAYGIGSVWTMPEVRGRGYAAKMMGMLARKYDDMCLEKADDPVCSVLYSDIGKTFYAKTGWKPFESTHLAFRSTATGGPKLSFSAGLGSSCRYLSYEDLPELTVMDEQILRAALVAPQDSTSAPKTRVALVPDRDHFEWHWKREEFMCKHIFNKLPNSRGVMFTSPSSPESKVWALWMRSFYGGNTHPEKNTFYILRLVVADQQMADEKLSEALRAVIQSSRDEAGKWLCERVEMWNPDERVQKLLLGGQNQDMGGEFVVRESESIASMNWHGQSNADEVEWIANEKYGWC